MVPQLLGPHRRHLRAHEAHEFVLGPGAGDPAAAARPPDAESRHDRGAHGDGRALWCARPVPRGIDPSASGGDEYRLQDREYIFGAGVLQSGSRARGK